LFAQQTHRQTTSNVVQFVEGEPSKFSVAGSIPVARFNTQSVALSSLIGSVVC